MADFTKFKEMVERVGLQALQPMPFHWQVRGGANIVNYYPSKGTIFVNGTKKGIVGSVEKAIELANGAPPIKPAKVERRGAAYYKSKKLKMLGKDNRCNWCRTGLTIGTATIDHRIPLKRGGSDLEDNLVLACEPCNRKRGHSMPELKKKSIYPAPPNAARSMSW